MNVFEAHRRPFSEQMESARNQLASASFTHIPGIFSKAKVHLLKVEIDRLLDHANASDAGPLIMYEEGPADKICRMEHIVGSSSIFQEVVEEELKPLVNTILGTPMALLKDKCNFKKPGGGGFGPHQDYLAYKTFYDGPHYTVALYLDDTTPENGALEFATNIGNSESVGGDPKVKTFFGEVSVFPIETVGHRAGELIPAVAEMFDWVMLCANAADIVLFDSLVPHKSAKNVSQQDRAVLFFTFVEAAKGEGLYDQYYAAKRKNPDDPQFHIATPMQKHAQ